MWKYANYSFPDSDKTPPCVIVLKVNKSTWGVVLFLPSLYVCVDQALLRWMQENILEKQSFD